MDQLLVESAVRGTLIAASIGGIVWAARITAPALLHAVWTAVLIAMLLMPLWIVWGPKASVRVLPAPSPDVIAQPIGPSVPVRAAAVAATPSTSNPLPPSQRDVWSWREWALVTYAAVAFALLARLAIGTVRTLGLRRRSIVRAGRLTTNACASPVTWVGFTPW
jgi:hypothetical protein